MSPGCFGGSNVNDVKPRPLDPSDSYQQVEILQKKDGWRFSAKSVAPNGFPPYLLRQKRWSAQMRTPRYRLLDNARGLDSSLRGRLPPLGSREVVGKWYCPFMFVVEQGTYDEIRFVTQILLSYIMLRETPISIEHYRINHNYYYREN